MFSGGLSHGVTCGPIRNTLGFGAKTGSPGMRLRLFERLGRLVGWLFGAQSDSNGRSRDPRTAGAEASGRHRRNAGGSQSARPRDRGALAGPAAPAASGGSAAAGSAVHRACPPRRGARTSGVAMPPLPRNYTPGQGGGIGRARIREAPFGAAPLDTATRPQSGADQAPGAVAPGQAAQAPRQPWYQVVGGPPAARRLVGRSGQAGLAGRAGAAAARRG